MTKGIKYGGITAIPSDYECPDGDLSTLINAVEENGSLHPIGTPTVIMRKEGYRFRYIHKPIGRENYILSDDRGVYWLNLDTDEIIEIENIVNIRKIESIGNTLMIINDSGVHYVLWQPDSEKYKYLGDSIPDVSLSFGLEGRIRFYSTIAEEEDNLSGSDMYIAIDFDAISEDNIFEDFSDENKAKITNQVLAKVNKFVREQTTEKGRFCFPFFVRYALRLYDGRTLVNHSAPILMMPSTTICPVVLWNRIHGEGEYTSADLDIMLVAAQLNYHNISAGLTKIKNEWSDIVKSVDIYITPPIYTYDQSGECKRFNDADNMNTSFIGKPYIKGTTETVNLDSQGLNTAGHKSDYIPVVSGEELDPEEFRRYYEWKYGDLYAIFRNAASRTYPGETLQLPEKDPDKIREEFESTTNFYLLKSISLDEIELMSRTNIEVGDEYLQSLHQREPMTDDYQTHDKKIPGYSFVYNQRVNFANMKRQLYGGYHPFSLFCYKEGDYNWDYDNAGPGKLAEIFSPVLGETQAQMTIRTYIGEGGEVYRVSSVGSSLWVTLIAMFRSGEQIDGELRKKSWGSYLYYPNTNAYKMEVFDSDGSCTTINLKPHDYLNGAYAYIGFDMVHTPGISDSSTQVSASGIVHQSNMLYTSEVNNPFYFPVTGINTIGTGEILGISAALLPMSQGQFGEYPLYVFSTEGIWAMSVGEDGMYVARQMLSPEVCTVPKSITQVDSSVLFVSNKGVMVLSGNQVKCLSEELSNSDNREDLPYYNDLLRDNGIIIAEGGNFIEYLRDSRIAYDNVLQRIYIFNPSKDYVYVYSNKSGRWGMAAMRLIDTINSHPYCYLVGDGDTLVNMSVPEESGSIGVALMTRPLKLGILDGLKTVRDVIQRGKIKSNLQQVLYGSRDLYEWLPVASSRNKYIRGISGTPYKYYRLGVIAKLDAGESMHGCTVNLVARYGNKIR